MNSPWTFREFSVCTEVTRVGTEGVPHRRSYFLFRIRMLEHRQYFMLLVDSRQKLSRAASRFFSGITRVVASLYRIRCLHDGHGFADADTDDKRRTWAVRNDYVGRVDTTGRKSLPFFRRFSSNIVVWDWKNVSWSDQCVSVCILWVSSRRIGSFKFLFSMIYWEIIDCSCETDGEYEMRRFILTDFGK